VGGLGDENHALSPNSKNELTSQSWPDGDGISLEVVLFSKGFAALVCHRAAHRLWLRETGRKKFTALYLQSQASALFGVDLHPLAQIGSGLLLDHGTGIVVGETASVGDGCTILHGVTLGGTGKDHGDRHPKVGKHVLIGAGSSILGNVHVGDSAKIGAGSVVLRSIPPFATAVGAPAKVRSAGFRPCESGLLFEASSWLPSQLLLIDFLFLLPSQRLSGGLLKLIRHMMLT
jgi:serine O-acetyltransferase